jgi:biotin synthase
MLQALAERLLQGGELDREEALALCQLEGEELYELFAQAGRLARRLRGQGVDLCSIVSAKTGGCPEDCSYCAQSVRAKAELRRHGLLPLEEVLQKAQEAKAFGVRRFCVVCSGRRPSPEELRKIARMLQDIRELGLSPCATLGLLGKEELRMLKEHGLQRYHHNLESSERFFPEVCSTHSWAEKLRTLEAAREVGLSVCSGGIFGLGEEWSDRVDMALTLRHLGVDSVPLNFLIPIKGTRLQHLEPPPPLEALKIVSLYRFILPRKEIRLCGGRPQSLGPLGGLVFMAGADGLLTGPYLTTQGMEPREDLRLIEAWGLRVL